MRASPVIRLGHLVVVFVSLAGVAGCERASELVSGRTIEVELLNQRAGSISDVSLRVGRATISSHSVVEGVRPGPRVAVRERGESIPLSVEWTSGGTRHRWSGSIAATRPARLQVILGADGEVRVLPVRE